MSHEEITFFGSLNFRSDRRTFGIKREDRFSHVYIIGKTGTGKSTLMETMALQDLERGNGFALVDPHGDLAERIAARIPASRQSEVIYFNAADPDQPYGYNPLRHVREDRIALAASGFMEVFKKMWPDAWGVRMEHILRNVLMALLEQPDATMHDILRVFSDKSFRLKVARSLRNEPVRTFLEKEYEKFSFGYRACRFGQCRHADFIPGWRGRRVIPGAGVSASFRANRLDAIGEPPHLSEAHDRWDAEQTIQRCHIERVKCGILYELRSCVELSFGLLYSG
jgi:hypothetical protein